MITQQQLDRYLGKASGEIGQNADASTADNHCAHVVSHVLGYQFGVTCQMMGNSKGRGARCACRRSSRGAARVAFRPRSSVLS